MKKPKSYKRHPDEIRVCLSQKALELIEVECVDTFGETGGMLVGHVRETKGFLEYEVTHATPPGHDSDAGPCRFTRGSGFAKRRLDYLTEKFGVRYLGEWHKHAVPNTPRASPRDRATMRAIARKPAYDIEFPMLLIANEDGRRLAIYASDRRKVTLMREQHAAADEKLIPWDRLAGEEDPSR